MPERISTTRGGARLAAGAVALWLAAWAAPAAGQSMTLVAKVNDTAISSYDVEQRMRLLALEPGARNQDLVRIALEQLVRDELKLQEGTRRNLSASNDEVMAQLTSVAQQNNMNIDQLRQAMAGAKIDFSSVIHRARAEIVWRKLVSARFGQRIRPESAEVDSRMEQSRFLDVRQVVIPVAETSDSAYQKARAEADNVRASINDCADLDRFAAQYGGVSGPIRSNSPGGGGKLVIDDVPPQLKPQIAALSVGETTEPVRSRSGYHVIALCGESGMSRSAAFNEVMNERAERISASYLEDLRNEAMLEFK